ncbi:putative Retrovirus-related Pol polyprotein from transposon opus [Hypsibius exemplaris]|uniref:Retrovirus-related Pol polyprotein from transposon opus n=1 Tax=Hypsibius exemplaris TaxID=2072580 RepID=A0A9X6RPQ2_HYPEX|nr:putative Retrovirus-related Pol polyprotein from transposon opus [Hypsibius exemplaris]
MPPLGQTQAIQGITAPLAAQPTHPTTPQYYVTSPCMTPQTPGITGNANGGNEPARSDGSAIATKGLKNILAELGDATPIRQQLRKYSKWKEEEANRQVRELVQLDVIVPCQSEWASNIVITPKKDGWRMAIDFRNLNLVSKKDAYPMPNVTSLFDGLHGSAVYTCLDVFSGYYNIEIAEEDQEKTAFIVPGVPGGQYMFKRMGFGLCNAGATFARVIDHIFNDIKLKYVLPYIDDFTVFSPDVETHFEHLEEVLKRIKGAGLKVKVSKCSWMKDKVTFLGHQISAQGLEMDPKKVEAITDMPRPNCLKAAASSGTATTIPDDKVLRDSPCARENLQIIFKEPSDIIIIGRGSSAAVCPRLMSEARLKEILEVYDVKENQGSGQLQRILREISTKPYMPLMDSLRDAVCIDCSPVITATMALMAITSVDDHFASFTTAIYSMGFSCRCAALSNPTLSVERRFDSTRRITDLTTCDKRNDDGVKDCSFIQQNVGMYQDTSGVPAFFCKPHFWAATAHRMCVCGRMPDDGVACVNGHRFHERCRGDNECPHLPCILWTTEDASSHRPYN